MDNLSIDCFGYANGGVLLENSLDIIENILYDTYGYTYDSARYNIDEWVAFKATAYKIGLPQFKPEVVIDEINKIAQTNIGQFIWDQDLKFNIKKYDYTGKIAAYIKEYEFFPNDYYPDISQDSTKVLATFRGGCQKQYDKSGDSAYNWVVNNTNEQEALISHNSTNSKDFPTLINNLTDISDYNNRILSEFSIALETFTLLLDWEYVNLDQGDWCFIILNKPIFTLYGKVLARVEQVTTNPDTAQVNIKFRIFKYFGNGGGAILNEDNGSSNAVFSEDGSIAINKIYNEV